MFYFVYFLASIKAVRAKVYLVLRNDFNSISQNKITDRIIDVAHSLPLPLTSIINILIGICMPSMCIM